MGGDSDDESALGENSDEPVMRRNNLKHSEIQTLKKFRLVVSGTQEQPIKINPRWDYWELSDFITFRLFSLPFLKCIDDKAERPNPYYDDPNATEAARIERYLPRFTLAYKVRLPTFR